MSEDSVDPKLVSQILASVRHKPLEDQLPCGCQMGTVDDAFVFRPCSLDCKYWLYAKAEGKRQGKPMMFGWEGSEN